MFGAIESHVLAEVGQPTLVLVLENRSGIHRQAHFHTILRHPVLSDIVGEPVIEAPDPDLRIKRQFGGPRRADHKTRTKQSRNK
ncbi:MAG: hypothetical protein BWY82_02717 [Verrucomicrobia bacterium ADurb.Bin474]|nr:MAG: hypothetical protein BWY82_02717 [Verrucomicrobia bacterium ADurb.Bin474]